MLKTQICVIRPQCVKKLIPQFLICTQNSPSCTEDSLLCAEEPMSEYRVFMYLLIGVLRDLACTRATAPLMYFQSVWIKSSTTVRTRHQMRLKNTISRVLNQVNVSNA